MSEENPLVDGGTTAIKCSGCNKELIEILVTNPKLPISHKFIVHCPYCGDKSYIFEVSGGIYLGNTKSAVYIGVEEIDGVQHIRTIKGSGNE